MSGDPEDQDEGALPRRVSYKRARPVQELVLEAQAKAGYRPNAAVRITGLQNAAHLNGCRGKLLYHQPETGRWQVNLEDGPEAGQNKSLKVDNLEPLDAPRRPVPSSQRPLQVGDRVEIRGLETRPELNGRTCLLLEAEATRWKVRLEETAEEKLMKAKHLHLIDGASGSTAPGASASPGETRRTGRPQYWIAGSWDNWTPCQMDWDEERHCYMFNVVIGSRGFENFLLLVDGDWKQCLHPDKANACPHIDYALCGPDSGGQHDRSWTIGRHPNDQGSAGTRYEVRLVLTDDNRAGQVDWLRLFSQQESSAISSQAAPVAAPKASPVAAPKSKAKATLPTLQDVLKLVFEEVKAKNRQLFEADPAWECIGGADKGGILVREGEELSSAQAKERLATGAFVKQRALKGERLHYEIMRGKGPTSGWVSIKFKEKDGKVKDLMVLTDKAPRPALKDRDLTNLLDKLTKAKVKTLTDLLTMLRDLGTDGLNTRLKAASQRSLLPQVLERLKHHAEAAERGATAGGAAAAGLPDPQLPAQKFEVVHEIALIRAEPATNAQALGRRLKGEKVVAIEETFDGFVRLEGDQGWIVRDMKGKLGVGKLLSPLGAAPLLACSEVADLPGPKRFEVVHKTVAIRNQPSVSGKILGARSLGEFVEADMQSYHGWVRLSDNAGWMLSFKEEIGLLLKPAPPAPKGPRIISAPVQQEDELDEVALWAQAEVARKLGRPPPPDPAEEARKKKEADEKARLKAEAEQKAADEEEKRRRDEESTKRMMAEARQREAEAQQRREAEEAEVERQRQREEEARRAEEQARAAEEARLEAERRRQQQEARRREEEARRREEEERRRCEEESRRQEQEEIRRQQEATEMRRREEELAGAKSAPEAAQGDAHQEHAELLERFREAVISGDNALIKSTRDAAKKGGVPVKEIGRVYAAAQEQRVAAG